MSRRNDGPHSYPIGPGPKPQEGGCLFSIPVGAMTVALAAVALLAVRGDPAAKRRSDVH